MLRNKDSKSSEVAWLATMGIVILEEENGKDVRNDDSEDWKFKPQPNPINTRASKCRSSFAGGTVYAISLVAGSIG